MSEPRTSDGKIPVTPGIPRTAILEELEGIHVVACAAPYGFGKTTLAAQVATSWDGPVHWFTAGTVDSAEVRVPASGTLVLDDVQELPDSAVRALLDRLLPETGSNARFVFCSRSPAVLDHNLLLKMEASGLALVVDIDRLRFTVDEIALLHSAGRKAAQQVRDATGGWPLAVGLARTLQPDVVVGRLCRALLATMPENVRGLLVSAALIPAIPGTPFRETTPRRLRADATYWTEGLTPIVATVEAGVIEFTQAFREAARDIHHDEGIVRGLSDALVRDGHTDLALDLLLAAGSWRRAAALLADTRDTFIRRSMHHGSIRGWVAAFPDEYRTAELRLIDARAAANLGELTLARLETLHEEMWAEGPDLGIWASVVYGWSLLGRGDARLLEVTMDALARVCGGEITPGALATWLDGLDEHVLVPAADLLLLASLVLLFAGTAEGRQEAQRLFRLAETATLRAGLSTEVARACFTVIDAHNGGLLPDEAHKQVAPVLATLHELETPPIVWVHLTWAIGLTCLKVGDLAGADRARSFLADLTRQLKSSPKTDGPGRFDRDLEVLDYLVDVARHDADSDATQVLQDRGNALWTGLVASESRWATFVAVTTAEQWLELGRDDIAAEWIYRTTERPTHSPVVPHDIAAILARLHLRAGNIDGALADLDALIETRAEADQCGAAARLQRATIEDLIALGHIQLARTRLEACRADLPPTWLDDLEPRLFVSTPVTAITSATPEPPSDTCSEGTLEVRLLAPEIQVCAADQPSSTVRGHGARLLALLVAADGRVEIDRAVDVLWPDADQETGRKRLHTTLYRLRRRLELPRDGMLALEDDIVVLRDAPGLDVDVWRFAADAAAGGPRLEAAVRAYYSDFCSVQFAYEDFALQRRRELRNVYAKAARAVLDQHLASETEGAIQDVARAAARLFPDDETVCAPAARVLARCGARREATEIVQMTAERMRDLGIPAEDFLQDATREWDASGMDYSLCNEDERSV